MRVLGGEGRVDAWGGDGGWRGWDGGVGVGNGKERGRSGRGWVGLLGHVVGRGDSVREGREWYGGEEEMVEF